MSFPANENLSDTKPFKKHTCVLDLNQFPRETSNYTEQSFSDDVVPKFSANENLSDAKQSKKHTCVLDLNQLPPETSNEIEQSYSDNVIPRFYASSSSGLKASVNMDEEALANTPLSFKRQETSKSVLVVHKGILTLVQHQGDEEDDQGMHKRGLKTSVIVEQVDGHFDLLTECVNYIFARDDKVYNRLEGWRVETRKRPDKTHDKFYHHKASGRKFRSLVEVEKFIKYGLYPPKPSRITKK